MQRPESPSTDLVQDDGQKSHNRDSWVHVSMELHPDDTVMITSSASERTVGDTTVPQGVIEVASDRGETLRVQEANSVRGGGGVGVTTAPSRGDVLIGGLGVLGEAGENALSPIALLAVLGKSTSPTTSTPGSTPSSKNSKEDLFEESGVKEGEISAIDATVEDDDIEIIKENEGEDPTLDGNSVEENNCQAASDPVWKSLKEKED